MAIHFPLLINAPKSIPITKEEHSELSYIGLASFMCSYPVVIAQEEDRLILYTKDWRANKYHTMPRFKEVIPGRINESAELGYYYIPLTTKLAQTIIKYFPHLFFKPSL